MKEYSSSTYCTLIRVHKVVSSQSVDCALNEIQLVTERFKNLFFYIGNGFFAMFCTSAIEGNCEKENEVAVGGGNYSTALCKTPSSTVDCKL